ncbi:hypothetical protein [Mycolicibacterium brisbanense]|nr:hypothetical protein [Mycolicibacterium brisbanense]
MARRVLAKNTRNRPISELHVQRLMAEMRAGRWQYNGEAIKWSVDDVLLDGQHRLTALSRMPDDFPAIPFLVVRGLPTKTQDTMDQGRKRSAGDQLSLDGIVNSSSSRVIVGAIRVYIEWSADHFFTDRVINNVSNPQVIEWAATHPTEIGLMEQICTGRLSRVKCRPSLTLAVLLRLYLIDGEAAREFASGLITGVGLDAGDPILTLRERFERIREQKLKVSDRDYIGFFIMAWNAWREGRKLTKFQRPPGGSWTRDTFPKAV